MDIPTLIRFLGGNYTGGYKNVEPMLKILREAKCDPEIISDLKNIFTIGCPNRFVASTTRKKFMFFFSIRQSYYN